MQIFKIGLVQSSFIIINCFILLLQLSFSETKVKDVQTTHLWIIWRIILDNPVHLWDVQAPSCHVCTQQNPTVRIAELEKCLCSLRLFLLPLENYNSQFNNAVLESKCV